MKTVLREKRRSEHCHEITPNATVSNLPTLFISRLWYISSREPGHLLREPFN